jgi:nucleoside-diphosphate-sugar epimerase
MKVLFIGGTGVISSEAAALAVREGIDLTLLNRGRSATRPPPEGARVLRADIRDPGAAARALAGRSFDAAVDWIAYEPHHVQADIDLFRGRVGQYVFISSAAAYQTPPDRLPVTEATPLGNPFWEYARQKIECERLLERARREENFPVTIVRPSHTYDATKVPLPGGGTTLERMREGKPVLVPGDGTSLWTLTHARDFARGFVPLLGNGQAVGEAVHITSDEWLTWNRIFGILAEALGVEPHLVRVPSELVHSYDPRLGAGLLGDKSHSRIFDNGRIRQLAPGFRCDTPFAAGAREIVAWHGADPARRAVDPDVEQLIERVLAAYAKAWPGASC